MELPWLNALLVVFQLALCAGLLQVSVVLCSTNACNDSWPVYGCCYPIQQGRSC